MLKLIDGKTITNEIKDAFKKNVTKAYIKLTDGTILSGEDYLKSIKIEELRYNEETENFLGEAVAKRATVSLYNKENAMNLENKEFEAFIGAELLDGTTAWVSFGNFLVQKPENNDTKESTDFEALDYMCKFNVKYEPHVTYPCTYLELIQDICNQCGVELGSTTFRNADKLIYENFFIDGEQCRVVIKEVAKIAFSWARVGKDNKLYIDFEVKDMKSPNETFTLDDYKELENNEETIPVNTIILANSAVDSENITIYDDSLISQYGQQKELIIREDYFAYSQEKKQELIEAGRALMGLVYNPIVLKSIGTIYLESNDVISVQDKQGKTKSSYCLNHTIDYNGVLYDEFESVALTNTETEYQYESEEDLSRRRTEILVNKATQQVQILAEKVGTYDNKIAKLEVDVEGVSAKVEEIADITRVIESSSPLVLENCMPGDLLELHIYGNNTVFENGSVIEVEYGNTLLSTDSDDWQNGYLSGSNVMHQEPYNSSVLLSNPINVSGIKKVNVIVNEGYKIRNIYCWDKEGFNLGSISNGTLKVDTEEIRVEVVKANFDIINQVYPAITPEDAYNFDDLYIRKIKSFNLGVTEVLRQMEDVRDSYDLVNNKASVTRRVGETENGTLYVLTTPITENLGDFVIEVEQGLNTIINSNPALMQAKYVIENEFTENFATTVQLKTALELMSNEINLELSKKVGDNELIARINMGLEKDYSEEIPEGVEKSIIKFAANNIEWDADHSSLSREGILKLRNKTTELYQFTINDAISALNFIKGETTFPPEIQKLYDINNDGKVNLLDCVGILNIIKGTHENTKYANSEIIFNPLNPSEFIKMTLDDVVHCRIGLTEIYNYSYNGMYMFLGTFVASNNSLYGVKLDGQKGEIVLTSTRESTQTYIDANKVDGYYVLASNGGTTPTKGRCLHGWDESHDYRCHWDGQSLIFVVDDTTTCWIPSNTSDRDLKEDIAIIDENLLKAIEEVELKQFRFKDGDGKLNFGIVAQELVEIFEKYRLNYEDYDFISKKRKFLTEDKLYFIVDYNQLNTLKNKCLENKIKKQQKTIDFLIEKLNCKEELEEYLNN